MNHQKWKFRYKFKKNDLEKIKKILLTTDFFLKEEIDVAVDISKETLEKGEKTSGYNFIFIEEADEIIGFACYGKIPCTLISYDLYWIAVNKFYQNKGYGKLLLKDVEEKIKAKGGSKIYIETSSKEKYLPTRNFYLNNNYIETAQLKDFYDYNDHKYIFEKSL